MSTGGAGVGHLSKCPWQPSLSPWTTSTTGVRTRRSTRSSWSRRVVRTTSTQKSISRRRPREGRQLVSYLLATLLRSTEKYPQWIPPSRRWYTCPATTLERKQKTTSTPKSCPNGGRLTTRRWCLTTTILLPCQPVSLLFCLASLVYARMLKTNKLSFRWVPVIS